MLPTVPDDAVVLDGSAASRAGSARRSVQFAGADAAAPGAAFSVLELQPSSALPAATLSDNISQDSFIQDDDAGDGVDEWALAGTTTKPVDDATPSSPPPLERAPSVDGT